MTDFGSVNFCESEFVSPIYFDKCKFVQAPCFFRSEIHPLSQFSDCDFLDTKSAFSYRAYAHLRHLMNQNEAEYEKVIFHSYELEAKRKTVLSNGLELALSWGLYGLNQYGRNLWLPPMWLFIFCLLSFFAYDNFGGIVCNVKDLTDFGDVQNWVTTACYGNINFIYSLINTLGPFGLIARSHVFIHANGIVKLWSSVHFLVCSLIWFVWIMQIRHRFKM